MVISNIELTPGSNGELCPGNGEHEGIECQCDECDYYLLCFTGYTRLNT